MLPVVLSSTFGRSPETTSLEILHKQRAVSSAKVCCTLWCACVHAGTEEQELLKVQASASQPAGLTDA